MVHGSNLVKAVGIEPHSTLMKLIFVGYGLAAFGVLACFGGKFVLSEVLFFSGDQDAF